MLVNLQANQKDASEQKAICEEEERLTNIQKQEANALSDSCESDLARVLPLLDEASKALEKIKQDDITLIKSFTSPPPVLDIVMQAVVVALGEEGQVKWKPKDPADPSKGKE
jgi:dynein heavy chain